MRRTASEAEAVVQPSEEPRNEASEAAAPSRCSQTRVMLIKRVYAIDPLACR
ncbi:MAG: hypothetical protein RBS80_03130 [Thermoguttaceae bacterium]|jgi:hypothetical protein|nr:hypothetical protein [Thermoguttaceae bacterium]